MHHLATQMLEDPELDDARCGRHYWDIDRLLADPTVRGRLEDRDAFDQLLEDVERTSEAHFGGCTPRPKNGFTTGPAFDPPVEIRRTLNAHTTTPRRSFYRSQEKLSGRVSEVS